jgi:hypothetical protein
VAGVDDGGAEGLARAGKESFAGFIGSTLWVAGAAGGPARPVYREVADLEDERAVERVTRAVGWV